MRCFYHPEKDAVGTCSQCRKAGCRVCIEDVGGALLCKGCISLAEAKVAAQEKAELEEGIQMARKFIRESWIITIVLGSITALGLIMTGGGFLLLIPLFYYAIWSWYWGLKGVGPWWDEHISKGGELGWPSLIMIYFSAFYYGILGGGIRQYRIHRQMAQLSSVGKIEEQIKKPGGAAQAQLRGLLKRERYEEIISLILKDQNTAFELVKFLEDPDDEIRENAAETIARIGKNDTQAPNVVKVIMPRLLILLKNPSPQARSAATCAITGIAWNWPMWNDIQEVIETAIPHLIELLDDSYADVRKHAIEAIKVVSEWIEDKRGNIQQLRAAIPLITPCLKDAELRDDAIWALVAIAHMDPEMVKPLVSDVVKLINDPKGHVRLGATFTLRYLAEPYPELVKPACSSLMALLEDSDRSFGVWVSENAAVVLGFVAKEVPEITERIMPKLTELLGAERSIRSIIREDAVKALAKIAEVNPEIVRPAVGKLTELLKDPQESVRESAAQVLQHLGHNRGR